MNAKAYFGNEQSFHINASLRNGTKPDKRIKEAQAKVEEAFKNSGVNIGAGSNLYRAVNNKFADQLKGMKEGDTFIDKGYSSTAGTMKATERFGDVVMKIKTTKDLKAMVYKQESEVLFEPGRTFKLGKTKTVGKKTIIEVEIS